MACNYHAVTVLLNSDPGSAGHTENIPDSRRVLSVNGYGVVRLCAALILPTAVPVICGNSGVNDEWLAVNAQFIVQSVGMSMSRLICGGNVAYIGYHVDSAVGKAAVSALFQGNGT